jgi:uncharacterized protein (DUF4415 family)
VLVVIDSEQDLPTLSITAFDAEGAWKDAMNEADEFDYQDHMRRSTPEAREIRRGTQARQARRARSKERITIRIDQDVLEGFKDLSPQGLGYQSLIERRVARLAERPEREGADPRRIARG